MGVLPGFHPRGLGFRVFLPGFHPGAYFVYLLSSTTCKTHEKTPMLLVGRP